LAGFSKALLGSETRPNADPILLRSMYIARSEQASFQVTPLGHPRLLLVSNFIDHSRIADAIIDGGLRLKSRQADWEKALVSM